MAAPVNTPHSMPIHFHNDGSPYRLRGKRKIAAWIIGAIEAEGYTAGEISFIFSSPGNHIEINRRYLGHDYHTDVITFDYSDLPAGIVSGDIFIDPATVRQNAATYGATARAEMLRVLIHGVLHLCGYGDKTPAQQKTMRARENAHLTDIA